MYVCMYVCMYVFQRTYVCMYVTNPTIELSPRTTEVWLEEL